LVETQSPGSSFVVGVHDPSRVLLQHASDSLAGTVCRVQLAHRWLLRLLRLFFGVGETLLGIFFPGVEVNLVLREPPLVLLPTLAILFLFLLLSLICRGKRFRERRTFL